MTAIKRWERKIPSKLALWLCCTSTVGWYRVLQSFSVYVARYENHASRFGHLDAWMGEFLLAITRLNSGCSVLRIPFQIVSACLNSIVRRTAWFTKSRLMNVPPSPPVFTSISFSRRFGHFIGNTYSTCIAHVRHRSPVWYSTNKIVEVFPFSRRLWCSKMASTSYFLFIISYLFLSFLDYSPLC